MATATKRTERTNGTCAVMKTNDQFGNEMKDTSCYLLLYLFTLGLIRSNDEQNRHLFEKEQYLCFAGSNLTVGKTTDIGTCSATTTIIRLS